LCERLAQLIRQDEHLVERIISAAQTQAAAIQRPDLSVIKQLEKAADDITRKIKFNMQNPGEAEEDEREIAETLRNLRRERRDLQDRLGLMRATAAEPVHTPTANEIRQLLDQFDDVLRRAASGQIVDDQDIARDILESLTGGRIAMHQQGKREEMRGWLQGRFTVKILDVLVEKLAGGQPGNGGEEIEVAIDFKRPRKMDSDADQAIALWMDGHSCTAVGQNLGSSQSHISRLLKIGAQRRGTTLEDLRPLRKSRSVDLSCAPGYQRIADEVQVRWWDALNPIRMIARDLECSTVTVCAALRWWYEKRGLAVPTFEHWCHEVDRRIVASFEDDGLQMQEIAERLYRAHGKAMHTVIGVYRRLGKELPPGWTGQSQLQSIQGTNSNAAT
jgi:hypothetical protein